MSVIRQAEFARLSTKSLSSTFAHSVPFVPRKHALILSKVKSTAFPVASGEG